MATIPAELADRFAVALYELASPAGALDAVAGDLAKLNAAIDESAELRHVLNNPLLPRKTKTNAVVEIAKRIETTPYTHRFIGAIGNFGRLAALAQIIRAFERLLARRRGEVTAEIASAQPLSDAQRSQLETALVTAAGRKVRLELKVDPSLLGGMTVKLGSRLVDGSLATKLARLKLAMKGSP